MSTHNIHFNEEIRKIFCGNPLFSGDMLNVFLIFRQPESLMYYYTINGSL